MTPEKLFNQALSAQQDNHLSQALKIYKEALLMNPEYPEVFFQIGTIYEIQKDLSQALAAYQKALAILPTFIPARQRMVEIEKSRGHELFRQGHYIKAISAYTRALNLQPDPATFNNLALAFVKNQQHRLAEETYLQGLNFQPSSIILTNLGNLYLAMKRYADALNSYQESLLLDKQQQDTWLGLGFVYKQLFDFENALYAFQTLLNLNSNHYMAHLNIGLIYIHQGQSILAIQHFKQAIPNHDFIQYHTNWCHYLFTLNYLPNYKVQHYFEKVKFWGEKAESAIQPFPSQHFCPRKKKLRIGYISPDFREHASAFFLQSFFKKSPDSILETFAYSDVSEPDEYTLKFQDMADHWHPVHHLTDYQLAQLIHDHQIDILVDPGMGFVGKNRLLTFIHKPAQLQISTYPNSTGLSRIDYRLTDLEVDPVSHSSLNTEKLYYTSHGVFCYTPIKEELPLSSPPLMKKGYISFGSFHHLAKINDDVLNLWAKLLKRMPQAKLVLKNHWFSTPSYREALLDKMKLRKIEPNQLSFIGSCPTIKEHIQQYNQIDISLDSFPYNGMTTIFESIWMGVPVVTLQTHRPFGRVAGSILKQLNLNEFVAHDQNSYCEIACNLANQPSKIIELRQELRSRLLNSPLCNQKLFARQLQHTYSALWKCQSLNDSGQ